MHAETEARWHGLDAVRAIALLLGVVLHLCMSFLPGAQYFWVTNDTSPSAVIGPLFFVIHMFRMLIFFVLAGFFARLLMQRIGVREFIGNRWQRVAMPLLTFWPLLFSAIVAVLVLGTLLKNGQLPTNPPSGPRFSVDDFPLTHLWFLYELLLAYTALLALRFMLKTLRLTTAMNSIIDALINRAFWVLPIVAAAALAVTLYQHSNWFMWFGIPTPDKQLYPNWPSAIGFGTAFMQGWFWQRNQAVLLKLQGTAPGCLMVAIAGSIACLYITGPAPLLTVADKSLTTIVFAGLYALSAWCWVMAILGFGLRLFAQANARLRYLADSSYWIYLLHLPLVMLLQVLMRQWPLAWWIKLPLALLIAVLTLLLSYHWLVRRSWIGLMLNGKRQP